MKGKGIDFVVEESNDVVFFGLEQDVLNAL